MQDPRTPRRLKLRNLSVLVVDTNQFSRGLIGEILRSLDVNNVSSAKTADAARNYLIDRPIDVILLSWDQGDAFDAFDLCRTLRRYNDNRLRKLPAILITSTLTRQTVIGGRDAGIDEFLAKPISPAALKQRLEMVIETPRPFVDCPVFIGPCRRRKNPADYYGEKRRAGDQALGPAKPMIDHDEEGAKKPIRVTLSALREASQHLIAGDANALPLALQHVRNAKEIAVVAQDRALDNAVRAFEAYLSLSSAAGQLDGAVLTTALSALEQLATLPPSYTEARESVAIALRRALQKRLAA